MARAVVTPATVILTLALIASITALGLAHVVSGDTVAAMLSGIVSLVLGGHVGVVLGRSATENAVRELGSSAP